ncbi:hypothetical protein BDZ97DRAFT_1822946, partial [Flammula alnicola]
TSRKTLIHVTGPGTRPRKPRTSVPSLSHHHHNTGRRGSPIRASTPPPRRRFDTNS